MDKDPGDKTFLRITNKRIYTKLEEVCDHVKETNGKVKLHQKWLYALSTLFTIILVWALSVTFTGG